MANRSYLYATDVSPQQIEQWSEGRQIGISEWNYDIPLVFKLLISGNTQPCRSLLWDELEPIALQADYQAGVARLAQFLAQITEPSVQQDIQHALDFCRQQKTSAVIWCWNAAKFTAWMMCRCNSKTSSCCKMCSSWTLKLRPPCAVVCAAASSEPARFFCQIIGFKTSAATPAVQRQRSPVKTGARLLDQPSLLPV